MAILPTDDVPPLSGGCVRPSAKGSLAGRHCLLEELGRANRDAADDLLSHGVGLEDRVVKGRFGNLRTGLRT